MLFQAPVFSPASWVQPLAHDQEDCREELLEQHCAEH